MKNKFILNYEIENLNPADYNPRKISEEGLEKLKYSINKYGIVKPLILNGKNNVLTAGHQRTKASKSLGLKTVPVMLIEKDINNVDEVKFNLFHNSIETNSSIVKIKDIENLPFGYSVIEKENIDVKKVMNVEVIKEISKLLTKYKEWGSVIVDENGNVIQNSDYAVATKNLSYSLLVYKMKNEDIEEYLDICNNNDFGKYYYENLGIKPYNQLYCQMNRIIGESNNSTLYTNHILKEISKKDRLVDFGAGKCTYVNYLKEHGYNSFAYEPHFKNGGKPTINIKEVIKMIMDIEKDVDTNGLYDKVVLDSVINSVTSLDFEDYVLTTCNALLKENGVFYCATRNIAKIENSVKTSKQKSTTNKRFIEFIDENGFSAIYRNGLWTMQHFHTTDSFEKVLKKYFDEVDLVGKKNGAMQFICKKPKNLTYDHYKKALDIEFNMEYPNNFRHNKHEKIVKTILNELTKRGV